MQPHKSIIINMIKKGLQRLHEKLASNRDYEHNAGLLKIDATSQPVQ